MRIGYAESVITPPVGCLLLGAIMPSTGVHDDLLCRALVLDDDHRRAALVSLDLVGLTWPLADDIAGAVRACCGPLELMLNCTHTHSAPFTIAWSVQGPQAAAQNPAEKAWRRDLGRRVAATVAQASANLEEATLWAGSAPAQAGRNRRLVTAEGVRMAPNSVGPTDTSVRILAAQDGSGRIRALAFNHAAHPVIVHSASTEISADFVGAAVSRIRAALGTDVGVLFAQGCAGNINGEPLRGGHEAAADVGQRLGDAALEALAGAREIRHARLRTEATTVQLPYQPLPPMAAFAQVRQEVQDALEAMYAENSTDAGARWFLQDRVACLEELGRRIADADERTLRTEVAVWSLGDDWGLVAVSHEAFYELSNWVQAQTWWRDVMALGYTGGCESYLPTDAAISEGGYEGACFPQLGAALLYEGRLGLRPGAIDMLQQTLTRLKEKTRANG